MGNTNKSFVFFIRHFFSYLAIGLVVDIILIALFLFCDLIDILNLSVESIFNPNFYLIITLILIYYSVFLPIGLLITLFLSFIYFLYRKEYKIKQFIFIKLDFLFVIWFILLYRLFIIHQVKDLLGLKSNVSTDMVIFFGTMFLLLSLLSLYFRHSLVKVALFAFRFLLILIMVPIFVSLVIMHVSLSRSLNENMSQSIETIDSHDTNNLNVLLITLDTCRADKLSCYNFEKKTSPNIDALTENGFIFDYAFSTSNWTKPATASLFTSLYPGNHQTNTLLQKIPNTIQCLPERFNQVGYHTSVFSANGNICPDFGFDQGTDFFFETLKKTMLQYSSLYTSLIKLSPYLKRTLEKFKLRKTISRNKTIEEAIRDTFLKWLISIRYGKFFAYIHFNTPHAAYSPPLEYDVFAEDASVEVIRTVPKHKAVLAEKERKRMLSLYYGEILYVDSVIGEIIDVLKEKDLFHKTIIVITADHGEEFYDHKSWGHAHSMFNELIHIPLIFYLPNSSHAPARISNYASIIDIGPTLLSLTGLPDDPSIDGKDLSPLFQGNRDDVHDFIFVQHLRRRDDNTKYAIIQNGFKYIEYNFPGKKFEALYDLNTDFEEKKKLPLHETPEYAELKEYLQSMKKKTLGKKIDSIDVELSEERTEELKALGYID